MIRAEGLAKHYGKVKALNGVDLEVPRGSVLALLGPKGAGKTTTVRILATLLRPDAGRATIAGIDVLARPDEIRKVIGLTGQYAAVDEYLTGRENLVMFARLYHMDQQRARDRAAELLEQFGLTDAADRQTGTYSGGMRRRLDLAASLVAKPKVIFLDEPTTGLDPRSRNGMWDVIRELVHDDATLLLTTQHLEEADALADNIMIIDHGLVIGRGPADQLKDRLGGERIQVAVKDRARLPELKAIAGIVGSGVPEVDLESHSVTVEVRNGAASLVELVRGLDAKGIEPSEVELRSPTLDEVFLTLTGHRTGSVIRDG
ncbi:daunorubicin resistance protein DrrA family ABC transporter ATP-binding protein [Acrocarpospora pleiomorpha]|uniref:Daunorubicin resistance protein DrrA family ABC transporter ATP-binding protein n=1 Tax=Acrocarpospora pleiomorpha TaxID=90975 RepID=A0A5M3XMF5_9ACTN|nr:ATP-binding cassette domain-containing protein [Acrocarpospora pleiomorpha]GES22082.1 daunorubicin resistance protein DrrA family ABC transporter ATP-binding protein [Acrocarpospora pleiomorpha]